MQLSEILRERGYVYQQSTERLEEITDDKKRTLYLGIDPSADSLQIGQLMGFLVLRRFIEAGHRVILVIGGATGMIGDPGGKTSERVLLDAQTVQVNGKKIEAQAAQLLGGGDVRVVNNADWLKEIALLDFLRDVGKHFSVNAMVERDSVRERLNNPEQGISYTEFSYMLLQAYDYLHLHKEFSCDLQVGGSDQWGNIVSGIDYVRRSTGDTVYALTWPLLVNNATGKKFGKSEDGTIWLDADKTSPFKLYQFFLQSEDEVVEEYLLKLTLLPHSEIKEALAVHETNPGERHAQRVLAHSVVSLVHGSDAADSAQRISRALFGETDINGLGENERKEILESVPNTAVSVGDPVADILVNAGLASSKREAREFMEKGAVSIAGVRQEDSSAALSEALAQGGPLLLLKRGKRHVAVLTLHS